MPFGLRSMPGPMGPDLYYHHLSGMEENIMAVMVLLEMQVKPGFVEEVKSLLEALLPETRAHKGCRGIDIYGNLEDSGNVVFYERWDSRQDYEGYLAWRTETGVLAQFTEMTEGPPNIRFFERVDI